MRLLRNLFILSLIISSMASCKIQKLSVDQKNFIEEHELLSLEKTQFYNSKKIVLMREVSSEEAENAKGVVKIKKGMHIEYVTMPRKTPGKFVAQDSTGKTLTIVFEEGPNRNFYFMQLGNNYYISQNDELISNTDLLLYDNNEYTVSKGRRTQLLFKKDEKLKVSKSSRKIEGINVE